MMPPSLFPLFGFRIVTLPEPMIEIQNRRHPRKKRRLQKKWRKRYGTTWIVDPSFDPNLVYFDQARGIIYCSRQAKEAIVAATVDQLMELKP